jgi:sugar (pentulose or hexulose) kinase
VQLPDGIHWDVLRLWSEIKTGIASAAKQGFQLDGIGLDTWGVDFALLDVAQTFLTIPDLSNFWLSGEIANEFTHATTTQCIDPRTRDWAFRRVQVNTVG